MEGVQVKCIQANQPTKHNLDNLGLAKMNEPNNTLLHYIKKNTLLHYGSQVLTAQAYMASQQPRSRTHP